MTSSVRITHEDGLFTLRNSGDIVTFDNEQATVLVEEMRTIAGIISLAVNAGSSYQYSTQDEAKISAHKYVKLNY